MKEDIFHFRDFSMRQAPSGQRINTDSCVFGEIIGKSIPHSPMRILDIGTGTGVLALMLALRFPEAKITGVEPEIEIARVAAQNFQKSRWASRLSLLTLRAQELCPKEHGTYDFILCNPPYFQNSMLGEDRLRTVARHNTDLLPSELYLAMHLMMTEMGTAWISFPGNSAPLWLECGRSAGLTDFQHIVVRDHPNSKPHMTVVGWTNPCHKLPKTVDVIEYRKSHKGVQSDWMREFRNQWYPEKYNRNFR